MCGCEEDGEACGCTQGEHMKSLIAKILSFNANLCDMYGTLSQFKKQVHCWEKWCFVQRYKGRSASNVLYLYLAASPQPADHSNPIISALTRPSLYLIQAPPLKGTAAPDHLKCKCIYS